MARAKRTDRAEARRRYRATLEPQSLSTEDGDAVAEPNTLATAARPNTLSRLRSTIAGAPKAEPDLKPGPSARVAPATRPGRTTDPLATTPAPQARPGIMGAIRGAARPLDFRGDLAMAPVLITRSKAIWIPAGIAALSGIAIQVPTLRENELVGMGASLFIFPPPMATPFLAGILAPRAAWLAGAITSLVAAVFYAAYVATFQPAAGSAPITTDVRITTILGGFALSLVFGGFIGGFAGFYKRFLALSSPNASRGRPANRSNRRPPAKAPARR